MNWKSVAFGSYNGIFRPKIILLRRWKCQGLTAATSPATHGTLAIVANGFYELPEPGTSYKHDLGHGKGDLRPQNTFH